MYLNKIVVSLEITLKSFRHLSYAKGEVLIEQICLETCEILHLYVILVKLSTSGPHANLKYFFFKIFEMLLWI